jgi:hypothetical protein
MHPKTSLKKSDLQAKQDLYNNFSEISYRDKKMAINLIIKKHRGISAAEASNKKKIWREERDLFLEYFGIEL